MLRSDARRRTPPPPFEEESVPEAQEYTDMNYWKMPQPTLEQLKL